MRTLPCVPWKHKKIVAKAYIYGFREEMIKDIEINIRYMMESSKNWNNANKQFKA